MKRASRALVLACASVLISACAASTEGSPSPAATSASTRPPEVPLPPLTIGILLPFTESAVHNELGVAQKRAAELYVQQQGGRLGGRDVKFVYSDESIDGALDVIKATELVEHEHADLLVGVVGDDGAYAVRSYLEGKKIVFIDTHASANALTRAVLGCKPTCESRYLFRSSFSNWQLSEPLGEWAARNGTKAAFLCYADDTFGSESAAAFAAGLAKNGGSDTGRTAVPSGSDWGKVAAMIRAQPTKDVFAAFASADAEGFLEAWAKAKMSDAGYRLFGPGVLTDVDVLAKVKDSAAGVTTSLFWSPGLDTPENKALVELFPKTYKDEDGNPAPANAYVVEVWDAMKALDVALAAVKGGTSSDALVTALEGVRITGARGLLAFDQTTHNVVQDIYIRQVRIVKGTATNWVVDTVKSVADPGK